MRRLIIISLVLLLCAVSYGVPRTDARDSRADIERKVDGLGGAGRGNSWYIFSGAIGNATGDSWTNACLTIEAATVLAAASSTGGVYDTLHVGEGHNEGLTAADGVDLDVVGLHLKGYGRGTAMPTLDYDLALGEFAIGAANVRVENIRFRPSANVVSAAIDIEAGGDNAEIIGCFFGLAETVTDEFDSAIVVATGADDVYIADCHFTAGAQGAIEAIRIGTVSGPIIERNRIIGDYSIANVAGYGIAVACFIENNLLFNGTMGGDGEINAVAALVMSNDSSGLVADNRIVSATASALLMRVGDDMVFINNMMTATDGDEFSGGIESGGASVTISQSQD